MITCVGFFRLLPPRENPVNTIFCFDVHLQHVLHVGNKKFTYFYKGITSPPNRGGMSPPIVTSTSGFSLPRARLPPRSGCPYLQKISRQRPALALRSLMKGLLPWLCLVSSTNKKTLLFGFQKANWSFFGSMNNIRSLI